MKKRYWNKTVGLTLLSTANENKQLFNQKEDQERASGERQNAGRCVGVRYIDGWVDILCCAFYASIWIALGRLYV